MVKASKPFRMLSGLPNGTDESSKMGPIQYVAGAHVHDGRVVLTYGVVDTQSAETSISVDEMFELLDGPSSYPFCAAALIAGGTRCDERACQSAGLVLGVCPVMCNHYPRGCDSVAEWTQTLTRQVTTITASSMNSWAVPAFTKQSQLPRYRDDRALWLRSMVDEAKAAILTN